MPKDKIQERLQVLKGKGYIDAMVKELTQPSRSQELFEGIRKFEEQMESEVN